MTAERYHRVKEVFLAVCDRPANEQDAHVGSLCMDDAELEKEVRSLLESHRRVHHSNPTVHFASSESKTEDQEKKKEDEPPREIPVESGTPANPSKTRHRTGAGGGRFESGKVLCERYRIVSLLGAGGMGEVYRAEDLTLDQAVALKFLPKSYSADPTWLERFHNEVRLSRQVTHPNVCRVFDIGAVDGEQFITMEFVDGEDLASLLRRIGRFPRDKALQVARQLCAGLAAAHDKGVLHRDLKPANVMLDGRGQVSITDFGISARSDAHADAAAGTPAYMAPEQFTRGETSVRSDIYSLGLVLYEVFTGHQAFNAGTLGEYSRLHRQTSPTNPSSFANDIDPLVERVILRCLEKNPARRPPNVLAVAAALPGGDPLAAALAAGETPTPEMVAAAGGDSGIGIARALIYLGLALVGLALSVVLSHSGMFLPRLPLTKSPEVLADYSRKVLTDVGYSQELASKAQGFWIDPQFVQWIEQSNKTRARWDEQTWRDSGAVEYWYREGPTYMVSRDDIGMVTLDEPSRATAGMRTVMLDAQGALRQLEVWPAEMSQSSSATPAPDFQKLLEDADIPAEHVIEQAPTFMPPMFADHRVQWQGKLANGNPVEIDGASAGGAIVFFQVVAPWKRLAEQLHIEPASDLPANTIVTQFLLLCVAIVSAIVLAWRNVRAGRGDSSGAQKLSATFLLLGVVIWLLMSSHVPQPFLELRQFFRVLGFILVPAAVVWMFYLALEPHVRRLWPETIISWSRVLAGRVRDRLVAAHILIGLAVGLGATLVGELGNIIPLSLGHAAIIPSMNFTLRILSKENAGAGAVFALLVAMYVGLLYLLSLVLFQLVFRRRHLASAAFVLLIPLNTVQWNDKNWIQWVTAAIVTGLILLLLVRYGLVATIASLWSMYIMRYVPISSDMSAWYAPQTRFAIGLILVLIIVTATIATRGWREVTVAVAPRPL